MKKPAQGGLSKLASESAIARGTVLATVMIAIVLTVVLLLGDVAALRVLCLLKAGGTWRIAQKVFATEHRA